MVLRPSRALRRAKASSVNDRARRWEVRYPAILALIASLFGALVGGGTTAFASWLTTQSNHTAQQQEFRERRIEEQRLHRTEAYRTYLDAANRAQNDIGNIFTCMGLGSFSLDEQQILARAPKCGMEYARKLNDSLHAMEVATDGIYIYGSG